MEYKVRKGLETPCRIGIFLSGDYWVVYSASVAAIGLCVLAKRKNAGYRSITGTMFTTGTFRPIRLRPERDTPTYCP